MAGKITAPRGTRDLLPEEGAAWNRIEGIARDLSERYAFDRIDIPLFERVELFARGLGESSDAVEKEMFRVSGAAGSDEARADWALRPSRPPASCAPTSSTACTCDLARCVSGCWGPCSATTARRPAATGSSPSGTSRCWAIPDRWSTPS